MLKLTDRPVLRSRRLVLRSPHKKDADTIQALANDWEVARRLARVPYPYTLDDALFFLEQIVPKELAWIVQHAGSGEMLGVIGLTPHVDARGVRSLCGAFVLISAFSLAPQMVAFSTLATASDVICYMYVALALVLAIAARLTMRHSKDLAA